MFDFLYPGGITGKYNRGFRVWPKYQYVQNGLEDNLEKAVKYHSSHVDYISNGNVIYRLLNILPTVEELSDSQLETKVKELIPKISTALGFSSEHNTGDFITRNIYGNIKELWIVRPYTRDDVEPIRVLRHPFTATNLPSFTGDTFYDVDEKRDIAVFSIDVVKIAIQYRKWAVANRKLDVDRQETTGHFITNILTPSILKSHMDVALFNKLRSRTFGTASLEDEKTPGLTLVNYEAKLNDAIDDIVEYLTSSTLDMATILDEVELTKDTSLVDMVGLKELPYYRTMEWGRVLATLPLVTYLLELGEISNSKLDTNITSKLKSRIKAIMNDGSLRNQLDDDTHRLLRDEIKYLLSVL